MLNIDQIPIKRRSQTYYIFTCSGTSISWRYTKHIFASVSSNHVELLALHESTRECIWLKSLVRHIRESCDLSFNKDIPIILFEDNEACIAQTREGYIKGDRTKHIDPKFFFTHELQQRREIDVCHIRSCENPADLFTKALPTTPFEKLVHKIGMRRFRDIKLWNWGGGIIFLFVQHMHSFSFTRVFPTGFFLVRF